MRTSTGTKHAFLSYVSHRKHDELLFLVYLHFQRLEYDDLGPRKRNSPFDLERRRYAW